jgi:Xaa-Pro aminopeptidase
MENLLNLQQELKNSNIDAYIIPTADFHGSEYISDYFKARKYYSGFTGSAGTLLVLQETAFLWTDGRYFIQAALELEESGVELMKMGEPNVPTLIDFINSNADTIKTLAFDGRLMTTNEALALKNKLNSNIKIQLDSSIIDKTWPERPKLPYSNLYILSKFFAGKGFDEKLTAVRNSLKEHDAQGFLLTALEDQAWLYNLRGDDVLHTPVFLSYTYITNENVTLFIDQTKIDLEVAKYLDSESVTVKPYFEAYEFVKTLKGKNILIDPGKVNYTLYQSVAEQNNVILDTNPTLLLKSIKNEVEIENIKKAHINDGLCVTRFMKYLKEGYLNGDALTEISLSDYIAELRKNTKGYIDLSFNTICAFNEHGAMMHYSATPDSNASVDKPGFLLIDSGGHYLEGTTDITRTYALGSISKEMKKHYTLVLKAVIGLASAVFLDGCRGINLDILARGPIWKELLDYKCGTGHGVGYLLSVHEAPNGFRWKIVPERNDSAILKPGMVTTDEPGIYLENKYGIRIENELLCVNAGSTEFGDFLKFETITYAPIDLDAIDTSLLNKDERKWINDYHQMVYEKLSPYMTDSELEFLKTYTREI